MTRDITAFTNDLKVLQIIHEIVLDHEFVFFTKITGVC